MTIALITINKYKLSIAQPDVVTTTEDEDGNKVIVTTKTKPKVIKLWAMSTAIPEYIKKNNLTDVTAEVIDYGIQEGEEITDEQRERMMEV